MTHLTHSEDKYRGLTRENDYRPYLLGEDEPLAGYRFGRRSKRRVRAYAHAIMRSIIGALKVMHEAQVAARTRRIERELQVHSARCEAIRRNIGRS